MAHATAYSLRNEGVYGTFEYGDVYYFDYTSNLDTSVGGSIFLAKEKVSDSLTFFYKVYKSSKSDVRIMDLIPTMGGREVKHITISDFESKPLNDPHRRMPTAIEKIEPEHIQKLLLCVGQMHAIMKPLSFDAPAAALTATNASDLAQLQKQLAFLRRAPSAGAAAAPPTARRPEPSQPPGTLTPVLEETSDKEDDIEDSSSDESTRSAEKI